MFVFGITAPPPHPPQWTWASLFARIPSHTQRRTTVSRTPSGRVISPSQIPLSDNAHNRQISMPPAGFEPTISASECPQTYTLDGAATATSFNLFYLQELSNTLFFILGIHTCRKQKGPNKNIKFTCTKFRSLALLSAYKIQNSLQKLLAQCLLDQSHHNFINV